MHHCGVKYSMFILGGLGGLKANTDSYHLSPDLWAAHWVNGHENTYNEI